MGRLTKTLGIATVVGIGYALWRQLQPDPRVSAAGGEPPPFPPPPRLTEDARTAVARNADDGSGAESEAGSIGNPWRPSVDGACPDGYPVKAKLSSGIFHIPGGRNYERTKADRCYRSEAAARADGLRAAQA